MRLTSSFLLRLMLDSQGLIDGRKRLKKRSGSANPLVCHSTSTNMLNDELRSVAGILNRSEGGAAETHL